jgi:hypothetical protein
MNRVDFEKFDGQISLWADRRRGIWCNEIVFNGTRNSRTGGQAPTSTSAHGLLVLALINALRSVSKRQAAKAAGSRQVKPRLNIVSCNQKFCDALRAMTRNDKATLAKRPFKAGRNFLRPLARELARFEVSLTTDADDSSYRFQGLGNFARLHVRDPKELAAFPQMLVPVVVSTVV